MDLPVQHVSARELRARFNNGRYWQRLQRGEFSAVVRRNGHPSGERSGEPFCTRSQIVAYRDADEQLVALVHQYVRPDGTIGGSGRPDPKLLIEDGIRYDIGIHGRG